MAGLASILSIVAGALVAAEIVGQSNAISLWLVQRAICRLAEARRERCSEEWLSHLADCPGPLSKLKHAISCYLLSGRRRPFDMSRQEALRWWCFAKLGELACTYGRYCQAKVAMLRMFAKAFQYVLGEDTALAFRKASDELCKFGAAADRAGRYTQATRGMAYTDCGDKEIALRLRQVFVKYAFCKSCYNFRSMVRRQRSIYAVRNALGITVTAREAELGAVASAWAGQHGAIVAAMNSLAKTLETIASRSDTRP